MQSHYTHEVLKQVTISPKHYWCGWCIAALPGASWFVSMLVVTYWLLLVVPYSLPLELLKYLL
jgi:hypothetical protein